LRIWIFTRKGKVIRQHGGSFSKRHTMRLQISSRLCRIPLDMHEFIVCTNVHLSSIGHFNLPTDAPFAGIEAIFKTADAESRSMILLEMLSKPVAMRIETASLRRAG